MKSCITLLSLTLAFSWSGLAVAGDDGDWTRIGNNLFPANPAADRVGIGVTTPQDILHLYRNDASTVGLLMGNSHTGSGRRGFLLDYHASNGAELWNFENTDMWFGTNGRRRMTIARDGRIGMDTLPHTFGFPFDRDLRLDVQGMLRVSDVRVWDGPGQFDLTGVRGCHDSGSGTVCGYLENKGMQKKRGWQ